LKDLCICDGHRVPGIGGRLYLFASVNGNLPKMEKNQMQMRENLIMSNKTKNVVITGSTRGIGLCMALEFLRQGCKVTISGSTETSIERAIPSLQEFSNSYQYVTCDVRIVSEIENLWEQANKKWGRVDIWINNAGRNCPYEMVYETPPHAVDTVIDTNIKGLIYGSQVATKHMIAQKSGQIWNMEGLGSNNMIQSKTILYGTSKHALTYFTKGLAKELKGTPVTAGRLSPGMMLTEFITRDGNGQTSPVMKNSQFIKIFNILADKPETVARFLVPKMIKNTKNNAQIVWLTNSKAFLRFFMAMFKKRNKLL
jgi:NAD(P)-dependent dehydrogenase (short-subunit alcohol dehydrogenase family)